jgi:hypothetical protein
MSETELRVVLKKKKNETVIKEKGENVEHEISIEVQNEMRGKGEEKKNDR